MDFSPFLSGTIASDSLDETGCSSSCVVSPSSVMDKRFHTKWLINENKKSFSFLTSPTVIVEHVSVFICHKAFVIMWLTVCCSPYLMINTVWSILEHYKQTAKLAFSVLHWFTLKLVSMPWCTVPVLWGLNSAQCEALCTDSTKNAGKC